MNKDHVSVSDYFKKEKKLLILTTITGLVYNVGMAAGPWFEGQLAQYLFDVLNGIRKRDDLVVLSLLYVVVIALVQGARALKRLYVRKFANNVTKSMKESIYHHLINESVLEIQNENTGSMMTKAIADAEACAEGMRKFTTEIFDTGVVMIAYIVMLIVLDWKLTLIVILFPPIAYVISAALKGKVTESASKSRLAMSKLNNAALDSVQNALTYRIYGEEENRMKDYDQVLTEYEKKNVNAGIWQNSPQSIYLVISMLGVIPILYIGGANVLGKGWIVWTIASFSSYLSCFTKLATKSSHAAKLFNAIQQAKVSWARIEKYLSTDHPIQKKQPAQLEPLIMQHVYVTYGNHLYLNDLNFEVYPGQIIGLTGKVASGKSTFGKLFFNEIPYRGTIYYGNQDILDASNQIFAYVGHDPELFSGTVEENITFGKTDPVRLHKVLKIVEISQEVKPDTLIGMGGKRLSGGQQARIALARALYSQAPVLILDNPFSAVDVKTEKKILMALRRYEKDRIILLISHRMEIFPSLDKVLYLENGALHSGTHQEMMKNDNYAALYALQTKGELKHA